MREESLRARPFIESPLAAVVMNLPAFAAWGLACLHRVEWPIFAEAKDLLPFGFAVTAFSCALGCGLYPLLRALGRASIHSAFALACLCAGVCMLAADILSVSRWRSELALLAAFASCVPPIAFSLAFLAARSLRGRLPWSRREGIVPASIAVLWLVTGGAFMAARGACGLVGSWTALFIGLALASLLVFAFYAARLAYYLASGDAMSDARKRRPFLERLGARAAFSLALPLAGIGIYAILSRGASWADDYLGFLLDPWVIALIVLSGASLCAPDPGRGGLRLALACLRSSLFCVSAYIMLVFLPFAPAIPFAAFFFGAGFLLALPLCNFVCHFAALRNDAAALSTSFRPLVIGVALGCSLLALPAFLAFQAIRDGTSLKAAISWVRADFPERAHCRVDVRSLERALALEKAASARRPRDATRFPLLSDFRLAVAAGGKSLDGRTRALLESAFLSVDSEYPWNALASAGDSADFDIEATLASSAFDARYGLMRSRIELRPRYEGDGRVGELRASFRLPKAAWLQGYYLYVGDEKRQGRLFERRAAASIYESKLRRARDPGLLTVSEDNTARLRVFPFSRGEERRTGFDILHAEGFELGIGGARIKLPGLPQGLADRQADWIVGASRLGRMPALTREPYLHVVADASVASLEDRESLARSVAAALRTPLPRRAARSLPSKVSFVDFEERARTDEAGWKRALAPLEGRGGFLPYRTIRSIALEAAKENPGAFPVFIIARSSSPLEWAMKSPEESPSAAIEFFPETEGVYAIGADGRLAMIGEGGASPVDGISFQPVTLFSGRGPESVVSAREDLFDIDPNARGPLETLVRIAGSKARSPAEREVRESKLRAASKESGILCPLTSYLVLEKDPDYAAVEKAEKHTPSGSDEASFTEMGVSPPALALIIAAAVIVFRLKRRRLVQS
jgi:hypothetical protein